METEKKLGTIEEELKLLKGDLKQALTTVRDYLGQWKLPVSDLNIPDIVKTEKETPADVPEPPLIKEKPHLNPVNISLKPGQATPEFSLIINLCGWITQVRKTIGGEHLPAFLEVYGLSAKLDPETKDTILCLAEKMPDITGDDSLAETWSDAMTSLQGILSGGQES